MVKHGEWSSPVSEGSSEHLQSTHGTPTLNTQSNLPSSPHPSPSPPPLPQAVNWRSKIHRWTPLVDVYDRPLNPVTVVDHIGPPPIVPLALATSFHHWMLSHMVPYFDREWEALEGSSTGVPPPVRTDGSSSTYGVHLTAENEKRLKKQHQGEDERKKSLWNVLVLHEIDNSYHIFAGYFQPEPPMNRRTVLDVYISTYLLMSPSWRPKHWGIASRETGERLDFRRQAHHGIAPGLYQLVDENDNVLKNVEFSATHRPVPSKFRDDQLGGKVTGDIERQVEVPNPIGNHGAVLNVQKRVARQWMPQKQVQARNHFCAITGRLMAGDVAFSPAQTNTAHLFPASEERLAMLYHRTVDPAGLAWSTDLTKPHLSRHQVGNFEASLALSVHHPANLMTLRAGQRLMFDELFQYIDPFTNRCHFERPVQTDNDDLLGFYLFGVEVPVMRSSDPAELFLPNKVALWHQAAMVVHNWNRPWGSSELSEYGQVLHELGFEASEKVTETTGAGDAESGLVDAVGTSSTSKAASASHILEPRRSLGTGQVARKTSRARERSATVSSASSELAALKSPGLFTASPEVMKALALGAMVQEIASEGGGTLQINSQLARNPSVESTAYWSGSGLATNTGTNTAATEVSAHVKELYVRIEGQSQQGNAPKSWPEPLTKSSDAWEVSSEDQAYIDECYAEMVKENQDMLDRLQASDCSDDGAY